MAVKLNCGASDTAGAPVDGAFQQLSPVDLINVINRFVRNTIWGGSCVNAGVCAGVIQVITSPSVNTTKLTALDMPGFTP